MYLAELVYFVGDVLVSISTPFKEVKLVAKPSDTIWNIKKKIEEETRISCDYQRLKLAGKPLENSYVLSGGAQLTLDLELKFCG